MQHVNIGGRINKDSKKTLKVFFVKVFLFLLDFQRQKTFFYSLLRCNFYFEIKKCFDQQKNLFRKKVSKFVTSNYMPLKN